MDRALDKLVCFLCKDTDADSEKRELIRYGLEIIILKAVFGAVSICIGIIMGRLIETAVYIASFTILRSYAGGYHAKSRLHCFIQSTLTMTAVLLALNLIDLYSNCELAAYILTILSAVILWIFAPIDSENKPLDAEDKKAFRKKTRIILTAEAAAALISIYFELSLLSNPITLAIITSCALLLAGMVKCK